MNDTERFMSHVSPEPNSGCWLIDTSGNAKGYPRVWMGGKQRTAHRAAWLLFRGPIPVGGWVLHRCDNRACANPDHLYLGDHRQNVRDAMERDRVARDERHALRIHPELVRRGSTQRNAKLSEADAVAICEEYASGRAGPTALARRFGVHRSLVLRIATGKRWRHVPRAGRGRE
jgi:hypothetical protein